MLKCNGSNCYNPATWHVRGRGGFLKVCGPHLDFAMKELTGDIMVEPIGPECRDPTCTRKGLWYMKSPEGECHVCKHHISFAIGFLGGVK